MPSIQNGAMNYIDLNSNQIVERVVRDRMGQYARNVSQFFRFLDFLTAKKIGVRTKTVEHSIHEEQTDALKFYSTTTFGVNSGADGVWVSMGNNSGSSAYNNNTIQLDSKSLQIGQLIRIVGTGTSVDDGYFIDIRVTARDVGGNAYTYTVAKVESDSATAVEYRYKLPASTLTVFGPNANATNDAKVHTLGVASPVDGEAAEGIFFTPSFVINNLMNSRESVEVGSYANSDALLADVQLQQQLFLKWFKVYQDIENALVFSTAPFQIASGKTSLMGFGGIPYYLRPHSSTTQAWDRAKTQLSSDLRGQNKSININGAPADELYDMLDAALQATTAYGKSSDRVLVASPNVVAMIHRIFRDLIVVQRPSFSGFAEANSLWEMPTLKMPSGNLTLLATNGLVGKRLPIAGAGFTAIDSSSRVVANQNAVNFGYLLDPAGLDMPILNGPQGAEEFRVVPVNLNENNNTFKKAEIKGFYGFSMDDPRAHGTIIFENV